MRVAIVGGGVSGLVAARRLHDAGHEITLFESADYPGGHTNTIPVETERGAWNVDTGFIVFNDRNYPNFERCSAELGVASQPAAHELLGRRRAGRFEWAARPAGLFARPAHLVDPPSSDAARLASLQPRGPGADRDERDGALARRPGSTAGFPTTSSSD